MSTEDQPTVKAKVDGGSCRPCQHWFQEYHHPEPRQFGSKFIILCSKCGLSLEQLGIRND
jgi:hypothetical protein